MMTGRMPQAAISPKLDELLFTNPPVAIGVSGGKDSQAAALATVRHLDRIGHSGPRLLIHADLGAVEWADSHRVCVDTAAHLGLELVTIRRKAGDLMDRWEARWRSSVQRYCELSTVSLVPCWSTPKWRFCTSEMKTHPIKAELRRRFRGQHIVNVTGIRRQESARRAKAEICTHDTLWTDWRPIIDWTEGEVFSAIGAAGMQSHPAYRCFGMSRVSCRFCIMSSLPDLHAAVRQAESAPLYRTMVDLEARSAFAFQGGRWLGDLSPDLLDDALRHRLQAAKEIAAQRQMIEADLQPDMLYVKGWPVRMLDDREAGILASVRQRISTLYGFDAACLDPATIHARYRELIELKASKCR